MNNKAFSLLMSILVTSEIHTRIQYWVDCLSAVNTELALLCVINSQKVKPELNITREIQEAVIIMV